MKITIISVGKLKEKYLKAGIAEYSKRLKAYAKIKIIEVKDEPASQNLSKKEIEQVKKTEGKRIINKIPKRAQIIALDLKGKEFSSEKFAKYINDTTIYGKSHLVYIIGGSNGLSSEVLKKSDLKISFGKLTYPHQLMRLILLEQIYRSFKILNNETYHK
ncbi:MAG: 23S rRNA (pseudouridine(1915)-N(3))-methyltransferase RlmH [Atopostipes suicloacalis]|nr:23S rRNA (pseudouridine(1915)-N(3))-methyltransferase RlmH [Atopostipes suicloacalis]